MKQISEIEFIKIGKIIKTHSFKGEILVKLDIGFEQINDTELFFVEIDGITVPFFINKDYKPYKNSQMIISLEDIDTEKKAETLVGKDIFIDKETFGEQIDDPLENIEGYKAYNNNEFIGIVNGFLRIPANPVLSITNSEENEILVPYTENFVIKLNPQTAEIFLKLPEGLIDINK